MLRCDEDGRPVRRAGPQRARAAKLDDGLGDAPAILCAACRRRVTSAAARIEIAGLHEHSCENPAGLRFKIGCFAIVVGCEVVSNPSSEWTWFPGWQWAIEACGGCRTHLGWRYTRLDGQFHGLILDRLIEEKLKQI